MSPKPSISGCEATDWRGLLTGYVLLGLLFLVILLGWTAVLLNLLSQERERGQALLQAEQERNNSRELRAEHERERLLNRAAAKEWQTYVQLEGSRNQGTFGSPSEPYVGMSDEAELERYRAQQAEALMASQGHGLGESLTDDLYDDARDLGLAPDGI